MSSNMQEARWSLHFAWGRAPYTLDLPEVVIGRGEGCSLQIEEPAAADEHARFFVDDDGVVWLESLHADFPTLRNGKTIEGRTRVEDGDFIQIGYAVFTLRAGAMRSARTASSDARTIAGELPEEVRRLMAERDAKNFVVGRGEPTATSTLMMTSSLAEQPAQPPAQSRETQRTIQANVDDLMAAIRKHDAEQKPFTFDSAGMDTVVPEPATPEPATPEPVPAMGTLRGLGPSELASAPTLMVERPVQPTPLEDRAKIRSDPALDLPSESTMIAPSRDWSEQEVTGRTRPRTYSQPEYTPLPEPMPPVASIPDLGSLVAAAMTSDPLAFADDTDRTPRVSSDNPLASAPTQMLNAVESPRVGPVREPAFQEKKTELPTEVPLPQREPQRTPSVIAAIEEAPAATPVAPAAPGDEASYVAPQKGMFGSFSRALDFFQQMFVMARREPALRKPMMQNLVVATLLSVAISALLFVVRSAGAQNGILFLGVTILYFVDYQCNALTAALINDYVTTGRVDVAASQAKVQKARAGIMVFAAISAVLDLGTTYARERRDVVSRILLGIVRSIWTTATYVILPAMVIEGVSFKDALLASKQRMERDPTGVGAGIVALSMVSYIIGAIVFSLAFTFDRVGSRLHPAFGMVLFFAFVNVYWSVTGWLKIAYSTCFYLWAKRCEELGTSDHATAPMPLRHALDAG